MGRRQPRSAASSSRDASEVVRQVTQMFLRRFFLTRGRRTLCIMSYVCAFCQVKESSSVGKRLLCSACVGRRDPQTALCKTRIDKGFAQANPAATYAVPWIPPSAANQWVMNSSAAAAPRPFVGTSSQCLHGWRTPVAQRRRKSVQPCCA